MQFGSRTIDQEHVKVSKLQLLSLYTEPPDEELSLDEFELFAVHRLQLLRRLEILRQKETEEGTLKRVSREVSPLSLFKLLFATIYNCL